MATGSYQQPLIAIAGPTASGKTGLAIKIAEQFGGEIICADSRTVYKYLDIGTAKPSEEEQARVPHHLLDVVEPNEHFTAADFRWLATAAISDIRARGRLPLLVGGTGLYLDSVLFDYEFGALPDSTLRVKLEKLSIEQLQDYCMKNNIKMPENKENKRYLIRAIEQKGVNTRSKTKPINNSIIVGLSTSKDMLRHRIAERVEDMFRMGVVEEATRVGEAYGWDSEAMTGNIYRLIHNLSNGESSVEEVKEKMKILDGRLAKRQLTWLRRDPYINWLQLDEAEKYLKSYLFTVKTCYYRTR